MGGFDLNSHLEFTLQRPELEGLDGILTENLTSSLSSQRKGVFYVSALIVPKQEATSDSVSFYPASFSLWKFDRVM